MTLSRTLTGTVFLLLLYACGQSIAKSRTSPLDYAELSRNDGWHLRIHGDGSGSLTHRQYPHHHLEYPAHTFDLGSIREAAFVCPPNADTTAGYCLTYYRSAADRTVKCPRPPAAALDATMTTAVANMQLTVDDPDSERSCRMLRRVWIASVVRPTE